MSKKSFILALLKMMSIDVTWVGPMDQMKAQFGKAINAVLSVSREQRKGPSSCDSWPLRLLWSSANNNTQQHPHQQQQQQPRPTVRSSASPIQGVSEDERQDEGRASAIGME